MATAAELATASPKAAPKAPAAGGKLPAPQAPAARAVAKKVNFKSIFRPSSTPKSYKGVPTVQALPDIKPPTVGGSLTIVVVILIGAAVILIGSALDNSSISDTFRKIMAGEPINWAGVGTLPTGTPAATTCPSGWTKITKMSGGVTFPGGFACVPPDKTTKSCPPGYDGVTINGLFICQPTATTV